MVQEAGGAPRRRFAPTTSAACSGRRRCLQARDDFAAGRDRRRRAARDRGRRDPRGRAHAGGRRAPVRRPTASSAARRGTWTSSTSSTASRRRPATSRCSSTTSDGDIEFTPAAMHVEREARRLEDDLRRRLQLPPGDSHDERSEADDPVAEHGPLPRRQGRDRPRRLPDAGRVLGRPDGGLSRGGAPARRARLHVPAVRRHEPRVHERSASARLHRVDRRRSRPPARRVHPSHQRGARRPSRRA